MPILRSLLLSLLIVAPTLAGPFPPGTGGARQDDGIPIPVGGGSSERKCATTCVAEGCGSFGLSYGKYCGVSHTGCEGEEPCDAYDLCCKKHDACVTTGGIGEADQKCHRRFQRCLKLALEAKEPQFSDSFADETCKAEKIAKTMSEGISMASQFSKMFSAPPPGGKRRRGSDL
jgi:hypothetical protein